MNHRPWTLALAPLLALVACASPPAASPSPPPASPASVAAAPSAKLEAVLANPARTDKEKARDAARHPAETLAFFGVREDATVVELWPGGGYYTAILGPLLADKGKLVVTHFDPNGDPKSEDTEDAKWILKRIAERSDVLGKVTPQQIAKPDYRLGPDGSADFVLTFRNVHNWIDEGRADAVFAAAFRVLKKGGVLGVEEHRGRAGLTTKEISDKGYVPEEVVIALAGSAGFKLDGRSEVNANAKDTKDHPHGVWSLPPAYAGKDVDHEKYEAIGESDRMTLRFVKP